MILLLFVTLHWIMIQMWYGVLLTPSLLKHIVYQLNLVVKQIWQNWQKVIKLQNLNAANIIFSYFVTPFLAVAVDIGIDKSSEALWTLQNTKCNNSVALCH